MTDYSIPDVDPNGSALQYRIHDRDGEWVLVREYPAFPRTPAEQALAAEFHRDFPTDEDGRVVITPAARERLDAVPGSIVTIPQVAEAHLQATVEEIAPALSSLLDGVREFQRSVAEAFRAGFTDDDEDEETDLVPRGEARLPKKFRDARAEADAARRRDREETDWNDRGGEGG